MPEGTLLVIGAEPGWVAALSHFLGGTELRALAAGEGAGTNWTGADAPDYVLVKGDNPAGHLAHAMPGGAGSAGGWLLVPATRPGRPAEDAVLIGEEDMPAEEVARRLASWFERERLAARQQELVAALDEARRGLDEEREALQSELARANAELAHANEELRRRVEELSRVNRELDHTRELNANVIEALQESLVACNEDGLITHWSRDATNFLGWRRDEVIGRPFHDFIHVADGAEPEGTPLDAAGFFDSLRRGEARPIERVTLRSRNGEARAAEVRVSALGSGPTGTGASGTGNRGLVFLLTDLARKHRDEEHLRRRDRLASLGELSAGVAHEIRNPLAGITTTAELLRARLPDSSADVEFVDVILEEVGRLDKIIADLLTFARPRRPEPVRGDLHRTLDRMLLLLRRQAGKRGIEIVRLYSRGLPPVELDPDQTLQLFLNLGLNAIDAMANGGTLTVKSEAHAAPRPGDPERRPIAWTRVSIADTGSGIPPEIRTKVFNPFFTTKGRGSGLGLAICQRIVEDHEGMIDIDSSPGRGTTVTVDFPLPPAPGRVDPQPDLFGRPDEGTGAISGGMV